MAIGSTALRAAAGKTEAQKGQLGRKAAAPWLELFSSRGALHQAHPNIDGMDLAARLRQSRLSLSEAVELIATVAEALHHAHRKGLVHCDAKPGNILLDRNGKPFVVDFGLALKEENLGHGPKYAGTPGNK
jgi:serine/threonine protein kinase